MHRTYWKRYHDREKPRDAKLELFAVMRQAETLSVMEKLARKEFNKLWDAHKAEIKTLTASKRAQFHHLIQASGKAVAHEWNLPDQMLERSGKMVWENHLFVDAAGEFTADMNNWEFEFLKWAIGQEGFVCWLRNMPRRDWAFCVPYEMGGEKPFYPDFILVRKKHKSYEIDLLEPHDDSARTHGPR